MSRGDVLLELPPRELMLSGFILSRGLIVVAAAFSFLWGNGLMDGAVERMIGTDNARFEAFGGFLSGMMAQGRIVAGVALVLIAFSIFALLLRVLSSLWSLLRLYGFTLMRIEEDLRAEYGALTRVTANIPLRRIQTLTVRENPLHRFFRRASVRVSTAQAVATDGKTRNEWIAPLVRIERLPELVQEVVSGVRLEAAEWKGVHARAFVRAFRGAAVGSVVLSLLLGLVIGWWAAGVLMLLVVVAYVRARKLISHLHWAITDEALLFRSGWITSHTSVARFTRLQGVGMQESLFDRRFGMARVIVDTAGAGTMGHSLVIPYLPRDVAIELHAFLARQAERTTLRW